MSDKVSQDSTRNIGSLPTSCHSSGSVLMLHCFATNASPPLISTHSLYSLQIALVLRKCKEWDKVCFFVVVLFQSALTFKWPGKEGKGRQSSPCERTSQATNYAKH